MKQSPQKKRSGTKNLKTASIARGLLLCGISGMVGIFLVGFLFWGFLYQPAMAEKNAQFGKHISEFYAKQLDIKLAQSKQSIQAALAKVSPSQGREILQQDLQAHLQNNLKHLLLVRVYTNKASTQNAAQDPLLGFAAQEMLNKAWQNENILPEVHRLSDTQTALTSVYRVPHQDSFWLVLVSQDIKAYQMLLQSQTSLPAYVSISQNISGQAHEFVKVGSKPSGVGIETSSYTLKNLPWQVNYMTKPGSMAGFYLQKMFMLLVPILALLAISVYVLTRMFRKLLAKDIALLRETISTLLSGKLYATPWFQLQELNQYDWSYEQMVQTSGNIEKAKSEPKANILETVEVEQELKTGDEVQQDSFNLEELELNIPEKEAPPEKEAGFEQIELGNLKPESVCAQIFRACDIRGKVGDTLTLETAYLIGLSYASCASQQGQKTVVVGYDGRHSSPDLGKALMQGIMSAGLDVINIGLVPTPLLYFATHQLNTGNGIMITGSHNPKDYNGFKMMLAGETLANEKITQLYERIKSQDFCLGQGNYEEKDIIEDYITEVTSKISLKKSLKVVIDCGNGAVGVLAERLFGALGCDIVPLYCEVDGDFPHHHPDPGQPDNLSDLMQCVTAMKADLGIAFDGDGDRLGVVTNEAEIIWPDRLMMLFAKDCLTRNPGANIIFDVKCTKYLAQIISENGGNPIMYKTGHALIKQKMKETDAILAGEMSGHFFFNEGWYGFDDGGFSAAKLLEILSQSEQNLSEICQALPNSVNTPEINVAIDEDKKFSLIEQLQSQHGFDDANIITVDGLRVEFADGWGLVRASNTTPCLVLRFEADDDAALHRIKNDFKASLKNINPDLDTAF